ncbi:hypothetical protein ABT063_02635, partial [Streptomyces sp. NPDC002838]|uniref:hypothetical protein n=1 Tax=Streptomyces sp. NPDC002838 TaxID=3154436 RepID=UPI0033182ECA
SCLRVTTDFLPDPPSMRIRVSKIDHDVTQALGEIPMFPAIARCRRMLTAAATVAGLVGIFLFPGPSAAADIAALSCASSTDVRYSPGLQITPRTVHVTVNGNLEPCTDTSGQGITAGSYGAQFDAVRSCADLLRPADGEFGIDWNGGTHGFSTISYLRTATIVGGNIVTTEVGTVIAGDFVGHSTLFETVGPHNPAECTTTKGVRLVHTNGNLTISPV